MFRMLFLNRSITNLFLSTIITVLGNNIQRIVIPIFIYDQTGSTLSAGIILAISYVPNIVLYPIGGMLADRYSKVRIMIITDFLSLVVLLFTLIMMIVNFSVSYIYILSILLAILSSIFLPAARSIIPFIASEEELGNANSLINFGVTAGEFAAPFVAILLYSGFGGIKGILIINIISFFLSLYFESKISEKKIDNKIQSLFSDNKIKSVLFVEYEKLKLQLITKKTIFVAIISCGLVNTLLTPIITLGYIYIVREVWNTSMYVISYVEASLIGGALIGSLIYKYCNTKKHLLGTTILIVGFSFLFTAISIEISSIIIFILVNLTLGVSLSIFNISLITEVHKSIDKSLQGRCMSFIQTISIIGVPVGNYLLGYSLEIIGVVYVLLFAFIAIFIGGLTTLYYEKKERKTNIEINC